MSDRAPAGGLLVAEVAQTLLDHVVRQFENVEPPLPLRRYLAPGGPRDVAWDCEQVTVSLQGIGWGVNADRGPGSQRMGSPMAALAIRHVVLSVAIVRAAPQWDPEDDDGPEFPDVETLNEHGRRHMRDAGLLSQALLNACTEVRGYRSVKEIDGYALPGVVESLGPAGNYASVEATLTVTAAQVG